MSMGRLAIVFVSIAIFAACGGDDADGLGVGAQCVATDDCNGSEGQTCLENFKGGYCGLNGCTADADCPVDSACVIHDDGINYCFRTCTDKAQCNENRAPENEANCSSSIDFVESQEGGLKACVPPSA